MGFVHGVRGTTQRGLRSTSLAAGRPAPARPARRTDGRRPPSTSASCPTPYIARLNAHPVVASHLADTRHRHVCGDASPAVQDARYVQPIQPRRAAIPLNVPAGLLHGSLGSARQRRESIWKSDAPQRPHGSRRSADARNARLLVARLTIVPTCNFADTSVHLIDARFCTVTVKIGADPEV